MEATPHLFWLAASNLWDAYDKGYLYSPGFAWLFSITFGLLPFYPAGVIIWHLFTLSFSLLGGYYAMKGLPKPLAALALAVIAIWWYGGGLDAIILCAIAITLRQKPGPWTGLLLGLLCFKPPVIWAVLLYLAFLSEGKRERVLLGVAAGILANYFEFLLDPPLLARFLEAGFGLRMDFVIYDPSKAWLGIIQITGITYVWLWLVAIHAYRAWKETRRRSILQTFMGKEPLVACRS